jgi:hypothetical protein
MIRKYFFKRHKFKVTEGDWRNQTISHIESYYLTKVDHPYAPVEHYDYEEKALSKDLQIICKRRPDNRYLQTEYYHKGENHVGGQAGSVKIEQKRFNTPMMP